MLFNPEEEVVMPGKKAHKSRIIADAGVRGIHPQTGQGRQSSSQTERQFGRDMKGRKGQFGAAGNPPLIKK
jgi:hypothetical protein